MLRVAVQLTYGHIRLPFIKLSDRFQGLAFCPGPYFRTWTWVNIALRLGRLCKYDGWSFCSHQVPLPFKISNKNYTDPPNARTWKSLCSPPFAAPPAIASDLAVLPHSWQLLSCQFYSQIVFGPALHLRLASIQVLKSVRFVDLKTYIAELQAKASTRELRKVSVWIDNSQHYTMRGSTADEEWKNLAPPVGGDGEFSSIAMIHQLQCLAVIRQEYLYHATPEMAQHCMEYIHQSILCNADTRLETVGFSKPPHVIGLPGEYVCRDWTALLPGGAWEISKHRVFFMSYEKYHASGSEKKLVPKIWWVHRCHVIMLPFLSLCGAYQKHSIYDNSGLVRQQQKIGVITSWNWVMTINSRFPLYLKNQYHSRLSCCKDKDKDDSKEDLNNDFEPLTLSCQKPYLNEWISSNVLALSPILELVVLVKPAEQPEWFQSELEKRRKILPLTWKSARVNVI